MRRALSILIVLAGLGCAEESAGTDATCQALCDVLVQDCAFAAYPSESSCAQGCAYNQEKGADVDALLECVNDADECDPFAIAECEHAHGG